jgi:hypothetical protein
VARRSVTSTPAQRRGDLGLEDPGVVVGHLVEEERTVVESPGFDDLPGAGNTGGHENGDACEGLVRAVFAERAVDGAVAPEVPGALLDATGSVGGGVFAYVLDGYLASAVVDGGQGGRGLAEEPHAEAHEDQGDADEDDEQ